MLPLPMKCLESVLILMLIIICYSYSFKISTTNQAFKYRVMSNFTMPDGPIYAKGWLKYTTFDKKEKSKPKDFFKNMAFYEQMKNGQTLDLTKKDKIGYVNIPDEDHFFFILTENTLNVLSSRKNNLAKTIDILNVDEILNNTFSQSYSCNFKGGVVDHGDFLEGFCFKIKSYNSDKKSNVEWELCADNKQDKVNWMNVLVRLVQKVNKRSPNTIAYENNMKNMINQLKNKISNETLSKIKSSKEVKWVPITSWSECSKPCGGGKSYLQRLCITPQGSKEKCQGERILTKDCNLQACDGVMPEDELLKLKNLAHDTNTTSHVMKYLPISRRPLRYERCYIKEGDLALYIFEGSIKGAKIPVRVILNNRTLTAYSNDDYESIIVSHHLSTVTGLRKFEQDKSNTCFEIEEGKKKTVFCAFVSPNKPLIDLAKEWQSDILDFIKNCENYYSHELDFKDMNEMSVDKVQKTLDFYHEQEKDQMEKVIVKTQQLALKAIEKELTVENMIEKEEELKQKKLEDQVNTEFEKIKKQKELIQQALQEKKKQADLYANKLLLKKKIKQISEQVKRQVMKIREDLITRIKIKKSDEDRKRQIVQNKINSLKKDISKNLLKASRNGNYEECNPERQAEEIIDYCSKSYENDKLKLNECVSNDKFCYLCCQSEYGDLHLESREVCYTKCDDYYIYKIKFKPTKTIKLNILATPFGVKTEEIVDSKKVKEKLLERSEKELIKTKFLETKVRTENQNVSNFESAPQDDMKKIIEDEKKRELLLDIKEDLNF